MIETGSVCAMISLTVRLRYWVEMLKSPCDDFPEVLARIGGRIGAVEVVLFFELFLDLLAGIFFSLENGIAGRKADKQERKRDDDEEDGDRLERAGG